MGDAGDVFDIFFAVLPIVSVVGAATLGLVLFLTLRGSSSHRQQGWLPPVSPMAHPAGSGTWNAEILGSGALGALGGTLGSNFGTMHVADGLLTFRPEDASTHPWSLPCQQVLVSKRGLISLNGADVQLQWTQGTLRCNVSTEKINRLVDNDYKQLRQRGHADGFIAALSRRAAAPGPG